MSRKGALGSIDYWLSPTDANNGGKAVFALLFMNRVFYDGELKVNGSEKIASQKMVAYISRDRRSK